MSEDQYAAQEEEDTELPGMGPHPPSYVALGTVPREQVEHRHAFGGMLTDDAHTHDHDEMPRQLRGYLNRNERHSVAVHPHPAALAGPTAAAGLALAAAITVTVMAYGAHQATPAFLHVTWIGCLAVWAWYGWKDIQWSVTWIVITPRRMMKVSGWPSRQVISLPWKRARDLEMMQDWAGKMLGYGTLIAPSVGTGNALGQVPYVPDVQRIYRMIWSILEPDKGKSPAPEEVE